MSGPLRIAFFGSSLVSSYWNGACTYYRGIVRGLHQRGHEITFFEPDAFGRQQHRDIPDPPWAEVVVWPATEPGAREAVRRAADADVVIKASGVGVFDDLLAELVLQLSGDRLRIFWDVDAPATLAGIESGQAARFESLVPAFDLILTYGGGDPVIARYAAAGAARCVPIYNALDPSTHHPVPPRPEYEAELVFLGNRLPDREARVEEFLFGAAGRLPGHRFLLGGAGWEDRALPPNIRLLGHVSTSEHNALNCSALAVLNVSRESMAENGFSPATRVFEAAGAGACLISDVWPGVEGFLIPHREVLLAEDGGGVAALLEGLDPLRAREIGRAARARVLAEHTYDRRAAQVEELLMAAREVVG